MQIERYACNICQMLIHYTPGYEFEGLALIEQGRYTSPTKAKDLLFRNCVYVKDANVHICRDCERGLRRFFQESG
jgi:hypothetical protein